MTLRARCAFSIRAISSKGVKIVGFFGGVGKGAEMTAILDMIIVGGPPKGHSM